MPLDSGSIASRLLVASATSKVQHARVATGSILTVARDDVTVTWGESFGDANYTVVAVVEDDPALGVGLSVERLRSKDATTATFQVFNGSLGTLAGTLHAVAIHD